MGEYVWTEIVIGGKATKAVAEDLKILMYATFAKGADAAGGHMIASGPRNYGNADGAEQFCQNHGLSYVLTWAAAPGCFDSGGRVWRPGMEGPTGFDATLSGDASVTLAELRSDHADGLTLADVIKRMEVADCDTLPPFEIVSGDVPAAAPAVPQTLDAAAMMLAALRNLHAEAMQSERSMAVHSPLALEHAAQAIAAAEGREG